ncbi:MAG: hypothetical protein HFH64_03015 [Lachnospiraceae bacterium]|nr:hypothetical protein [Lachnospiraceae bacterium]
MKKMLKRIIPDRNVWLISAFFVIGIQTIHLGLFVGRNLYSLCFLDMFSMSDMYSMYILFPLISVLTIYILRNEFTVMQTIREKSLFHIWYRICIKLILTSLYLAAVSTCYLSVLGFFATQKIFTWDQTGSAYTFILNELCRKIPIWYIIVLYFSNTFISMLFSMIIPFFTYWILGNYSLGVLFSTVFWYSSTLYAMPYIVFSGCKYSAIQHGFDWKYQFQIPYGVVFLLFFAGAFLIRQRDFLTQKKEGL